ncbi:hypothetical protein FNV43_RR02847 [Rhamnella rubrinervis]|uniref:Protein kinase domain-containing protein n=1 Tax=Rhamnella rubrinervis TaxID=2594499 RepID=A0A8K0HIN6_9ROSA|nr:hypothetical protein FNV43_RR02847 [Rhamnella rubrinervis]
MSCFPCFQSQRSKKSSSKNENGLHSEVNNTHEIRRQTSVAGSRHKKDDQGQVENKHISSQSFTFRELANATKNFRQECLLGEGGFGRVYRGTLPGSGQVVAVKQLDRNGVQGNKEFLLEVSSISSLQHPNLVNLIGYCADGDQRILVYEYMSGGSLDNHILDLGQNKKALDWFTRIKIALGAAKGLEYLHESANPPVIYRDLKSSNILLDESFNPKLSDIGLAKNNRSGDKMPASSRVMGTFGYSAPEYSRNGNLTVKSDVYSYGVVLLELITGRRAVDTTRPNEEQNLVSWAQPFFRDPKKFPELADPLLKGQFPEKDLNQAVAIAAMCLQEEAAVRPLISDVVVTLSFLSTTPANLPLPAPTSSDKKDHLDSRSSKHRQSDSSDHEESAARYDEESEDEVGEHVGESTKHWHSNSSRKSSTRASERSVSSSYKGSSISDDASVSSSHRSSSKRSSRKSSNRGSSHNLIASLSRGSSKISGDGSVTFSHKSSSKGSENAKYSFDRSSSSASQGGRLSVDNNSNNIGGSSRRSQDGSVSSHTSSR